MFSGSLAGTGAAFETPQFTTLVTGPLKACLRGPAGQDFDLFLQRLYGSTWSVVQSSAGGTADETISVSLPAGTYRWVVQSFRGSGVFTLEVTQ